MFSAKSDSIYRILKFQYLVDFFESGELYFAPPASWEDPYEKILLHCRSHAFYAQCWCKRAVSDAIWRIYSPDRTSVRIKATRAKLQVLLKEAKQDDNFDFLIEDVEYMPPRIVDQKIAMIGKELKTKFNSRKAAGALLLKRDAFDHEAEVQVIVHDKSASDTSKAKPSIRIKVDAHALVESILFDPRAENVFVRLCTFYIQNKLRFRQKVGKSSLYRLHDPIDIREQ